MNVRCSAVLFIVSLALSGCDNARATIANWFGATDKAPTVPVTYDCLCDPSSGSTCDERTLREVVEVALRRAAGRPGSVVRVWMQGRNLETTRLVAEARSGKPLGTGRRARIQYETRWVSSELASISAATAGVVRKRVHRSPIAEGIGLVALAPPAAKSARELVVITDGMEVSDFGEFECGPLPKPERFARVLARNRVLPPGSLAGVRVHFCHFDVGAIDRSRCANSLSRAAQIRTLWQTALTAAGASSVEIRQGGLDPTPTPTSGKVSSDAQTLQSLRP